MQRLGHVQEPPTNIETFQTCAPTSESQEDSTDPTSLSSPTEPGVTDESFASIDEFVDVIEQDSLNLQFPTNQP